MTGLEIASAWQSVERAVEEHAKFPPGALSSFSWDRIAQGDVVTRRDPDGRVIGAGVLDCTRSLAWLSLTDDTPLERVKGLTEFSLEGRWAGPKSLYQYFDMPWPVTDRHWVIDLTNNVDLPKHADVWERAWRVDTKALAAGRALIGAEKFDGAIALTKNEGSWLLVPIDQGRRTFAVYQVGVDIGGNVPEDIAQAVTVGSIDDMYVKVERNAKAMGPRYGRGCTPQPGGDGQPIPCFTGG